MNAIITGATKGIGRALALHLAANNYNLALCARNADEVEIFIKELTATFPGLNFYGRAADLGNSSDVKAFGTFATDCLETVDLLINNAGLFMPSGLMEEAPDALERQMQVNVHAPHYLSKFFAQGMISRKRGHIVNICSIASVKLLTGSASYSISKAALLSLSRILRDELMSSGIRVTAVLPGATLTDSWSGTSLPAERFVNPEDVARAVLASVQMSAGANIDEVIIRPLLGEI
jgi:3-oxoacyl-[acyl-carrier protein] reductase